MTDLNPRYVRVVIDHFAQRMRAELDRVEAEMRAGLPGCSTFRYVYSADDVLGGKTVWREAGLVLGFVQCRTALGTIHSATVRADLGTGEVSVTGWPLEEGSGWARG